MHADEVAVDDDLVRGLLADQHPALADRPLRRIATWGTDHVIYRLGDDLSVRLPKVAWADGQGERERRWLARLGPHLPVDVPVPVALGGPGRGYPFRWYLAPWIEGEHPDPDDPRSLDGLVDELVAFVVALRACSTEGAPSPRPGRRGGPLAGADRMTQLAADRLRRMSTPPERSFPGMGPDEVDVLLGIWRDGVDAPAWDRAPVWVHGDLMDGNLLLRDGHLAGVIDWSGLMAGDPAVELMCAWSLFDEPGRAALRTALDVDDDTWRRGRAWAVSAALQALPYYRDTNPDIVTRSLRTTRAVLTAGSAT
jgi:aminoglycoside phosphotransferase (APT) family kinase protein